MRTAIIISSILLCSVTSVNAQWWGSEKIDGNGDVITKTRSLSEYDQVIVAGNMDVALVNGKEGDLTVKAESNLLEYIMTEVNGSALKIYVKKGYSIDPSRNSKLLITVPFKDIDKVSLSGSGDVFNKDVIKSPEFTSSISGSGDMQLNIEAEEVKISITGSGGVKVIGTTNSLVCVVTGSGGLNAAGLESKNVNASVTGSGDIKVNVKESLKARVTGSGDIDYTGNPKREDKKVTGSGDITSI